MPTQDPQLFHVGIKAFLTNGKKLLIVREADTQQWEIPGGRINVGEEFLSHQEILRREIEEELGPKVSYSVRGIASSFVRQRTTSGQPGDFVCLIAYACDFTRGEIQLSNEHSEYAWVDLNTVGSYDVLPAYVRPLQEFLKTM